MHLAIESILQDADVSEVMISGYEQVLIEKRGVLQDVPTPYRDNEHLMTDIQRLFELADYHPQPQEFLMDLRLGDDTLINVVLPPVALNGPTVTMRKLRLRMPTFEQLIEWGSWTPEIVAFLQACIEARLNILIAGGTGSGKTTIMNLLCTKIDPSDRVVICEEFVELQIKLPRVTRLMGRRADQDGRGRVTLTDLVVNATKMRPDRILTPEPRDGAAYHLLQAMNTGHDGTIFTMHATSPRDAIARLEIMAGEGNPSVSLVGLREMIASAIDLIIYQERQADGNRRISKITEVSGMQHDLIIMQDIFEFRQTGMQDGKLTGYHTPTGVIPHFIGRLQQTSVPVKLPEMFAPR